LSVVAAQGVVAAIVAAGWPAVSELFHAAAQRATGGADARAIQRCYAARLTLTGAAAGA
tara:strand:+ start:886 stop:1062 length:177 start_codon:yes stop_codon:yes gene_type:complete